jgi:hypothetical protein
MFAESCCSSNKKWVQLTVQCFLILERKDFTFPIFSSCLLSLFALRHTHTHTHTHTHPTHKRNYSLPLLQPECFNIIRCDKEHGPNSTQNIALAQSHCLRAWYTGPSQTSLPLWCCLRSISVAGPHSSLIHTLFWFIVFMFPTGHFWLYIYIYIYIYIYSWVILMAWGTCAFLPSQDRYIFQKSCFENQDIFQNILFWFWLTSM